MTTTEPEKQPIARRKKPRPHEEVFASWRRGAVIILRAPGPDATNDYRPAAFIFDKPGGFAWVEPSYADPYGASSPAFHAREGSFTPTADGFVIWHDDGMIAVCAGLKEVASRSPQRGNNPTVL